MSGREKERRAGGVISLCCGLFIVAMAAGFVPLDESDLSVPRWTLAVCGAVFLSGGVALLTRPDSPWQQFSAATLVAGLGTVGIAVALLGNDRGFSGGIPFLDSAMNIRLSRFVFGSGALLCFLYVGWILRRAFGRRKTS